MWRLIGAVLTVAFVGLAGVVAYRTATFAAAPAVEEAAAPQLEGYTVDVDGAAARLGAAIGFRTVSLTGAAGDEPQQFAAFHAWLAETYPAFHALARRETFGAASLMYTWEGADKAQPPLLLLAHQDVVPVPEDTRASWEADPFGGELREGAVWGRGALDDKASLIALMEAAEMFASAGRAPARTLIFAFGDDEELGGEGAMAMAAALKARGVRAWFALDEGMAVIAEHPMTGGPVALIGISEKGAGDLLITAVGEPGHSSAPPPQTAVSRLAEAVGRVHAMPIAHRVGDGPAGAMARALNADLPLATRAALANEWLFGPLIHARFADDATAMALIGTTVAPTMIAGGSRPNVLPGEATAVINMRIHPRDTSAELLARAQNAVRGLDGVSVAWREAPREASPVSRIDTSAYALIVELTRELYPGTPIAPGLVIGGTDSRHYADVAENVYRFQPLLFTKEDIAMLHGLNERITLENFERLIRFDLGLIEAGAMP